MGRPRNEKPTYRRHKQSGRAIITIYDPQTSRRRDILLGDYGSPESKIEYDRIVDKLTLTEPKEINWQPVRFTEGVADITIAEVAERFFTDHANEYFRHPDGRPTSELYIYRRAVRELVLQYGLIPAADFTAKKLKALQRSLVTKKIENPRNPDAPQTLARTTINHYVQRVKGLFTWGVSEGLIPPSISHSLSTVKGLKKNRTDARESEEITPVNDAYVEAVLPFVGNTIAAMIRVQRLTAMRPGEVCMMTTGDLDTKASVWVYRPRWHKNAWRGINAQLQSDRALRRFCGHYFGQN